MFKNLTFTFFALSLALLSACGKGEDDVTSKKGNGSDTFVFDVDAAKTPAQPKERQRTKSTPKQAADERSTK